MTEEEIIGLGNYCEEMMLHGHFNSLCSVVRENAFKAFLSTEPTESKKREDIYNEVWGLQTFLGLAQSFVIQRDQLRANNEDEQTRKRDDADQSLDY